MGNKNIKMYLNNQLVQASKKGNLSKVKKIIEKGADVHAQNYEALRSAADGGHLELVKYLVTKGADVHADDDQALRSAAIKGHLELVKYLVTKGADVHAKDDSALRSAAIKGHLEVVNYLIKVCKVSYIWTHWELNLMPITTKCFVMKHCMIRKKTERFKEYEQIFRYNRKNNSSFNERTPCFRQNY